MKILIAGLGSIGRRHLRNLVALGQQDILLYRTNNSTLPEDELSSFPVETDIDAALAHRPDAVVVSNPTALHLAVALPAVKAGCHLFLEKPVAAQLDSQVKQLLQLAHQSDIKSLVGFQFRFHPVLQQIHALMTSGEVGRPYSFRVHWGEYLPGWHPWEDYRNSYAARKDLGGGVVHTLCHPLDYARWLFGEVVSLKATVDHLSALELDVDDMAEITLKFQGGCIGSIHLDYYQRPPAHWMEINCEKGHIRWDNDAGSAKIYYSDHDRWDVVNPRQNFERNDLFLEEMRHFIRLIEGKETSRCTLQDGIRALEIAQAIHASSDIGSEVLP